MRITTIRGESISQIEISEDVELENFIALCQMEHIDLSSGKLGICIGTAIILF